jgi:hypothetical protein
VSPEPVVAPSDPTPKRAIRKITNKLISTSAPTPVRVHNECIETVGNAGMIRRIDGAIEHIVEEWMPYKDARYEYEELVDELEPYNLGKPYELLRDYIRDDCSREDLQKYLTNRNR